MSHLLLSGQSCNGSFLLLKLSAKLRNPRYTLLIARLGHLGRTRGLADKHKVLSQLVNEVNQDRTQLTFHAPQGPQQHPKRNATRLRTERLHGSRHYPIPYNAIDHSAQNHICTFTHDTHATHLLIHHTGESDAQV